MVRANFANAKTFLQTNRPYDPRLDIPTDAVVVHPHNLLPHDPVCIHDTWKGKTPLIGRMFFSDSDDLNEYWSGQWDGSKHEDEVEIQENGSVVKCSGIRPYMVATDSWINYLRERKVEPSLQNGADAILPEEPLGHTFAGYESTLEKFYEETYGIPWVGKGRSELEHYQIAKLKAELYHKLEGDLCACTKAHAKKTGRDISFVVPIHSLFSNKANQLTAPLGLSLADHRYDGYIGQIWTGPINWCLENYQSAEKSFFASAYTLYDYFVQLVKGSGKKLWLLIDPVEDDPHHTWSDFRGWYQDCATAMLLMKEVDSYEVMPWPERIFLPISFTPGIEDKSDAPIPKDYLTLVLSITQALQEMPLGGEWLGGMTDSQIGIAVADSAMWQKNKPLALQGLYGLRMPLLQRGINVSNCVMERLAEPSYGAQFKIIVLSYEDWKPYDERMQVDLQQWVSRGGVLLILGKNGDVLDSEASFWWKRQGFASPLDSLLAAFNLTQAAHSKHGKGEVYYNPASPEAFADPQTAECLYLPLLKAAAERAGIDLLKESGSYVMQRGQYLIAHSGKEPFFMEGRHVDIFSPELRVVNGIRLETGSGIFKRVGDGSTPRVLHCTYRLIAESFDGNTLSFVIKGPEGTELMARIFSGSRTLERAGAFCGGVAVEISVENDGDTLKIVSPNHAAGVQFVLLFH